VVNYFELRNNKNFIESLTYDLTTERIYPQINTYDADNLEFFEARSSEKSIKELVAEYFPNNYSMQTLDVSKDLS